MIPTCTNRSQRPESSPVWDLDPETAPFDRSQSCLPSGRTYDGNPKIMRGQQLERETERYIHIHVERESESFSQRDDGSIR
ncbi:hypothetical protein L1987_03539 [Smallanthus sonchifolius]|uniref:Uncharacterized protein n=1 Tax=Smallanthus sonchifolius TaxID=185202 RepID=A0ACB9KB56_9ASTR|nr:hypothetical protein L1987_03539 [Smallanthus sonchifolius]